MAIVLLTHIATADAQSPQDAADRAVARVHMSTYMAARFAAPSAGSPIHAAHVKKDSSGIRHAWIIGDIVEDQRTAPRIAPWLLTMSAARSGPPSLPHGAEQGGWNVEITLDDPTIAPGAEGWEMALAQAFAHFCKGRTHAARVDHGGDHYTVTGRVLDEHLTHAMLAGDFCYSPSLATLKHALLTGLCAPYANSDTFGWDQIARSCTALRHLHDRIFLQADVSLVLLNALPPAMTEALFEACFVPRNVALRPQDPGFQHGVHPSLNGPMNDIASALASAYLPFGRGGIHSPGSYTDIAAGLTLDPGRYVREVAELWTSRGIDLNPPSTRRMEGLMP